MNTKIREWMPNQAKECEAHFKKKYDRTLDQIFTTDKYQLMHLEMFNHGLIHAECIGGDIDLLLNQRATIGCFPWRSWTASPASPASSPSWTTSGTRRSLRRRRSRS